jgi:hypothetical protein
MSDCLLKIIEQSGGELTVEDALEIFKRIQKKYNNPKWNPTIKAEMERPATEADIKAYEDKLATLTPEGRLQEAARQAFEEAIHEKQEALRRQYLQTSALTEGLSVLAREGKRKDGKSIVGFVNGLKNILSGDPKGRGEYQSLEARRNGTVNDYMMEIDPAIDAYKSFMGFKVTEENEIKLVQEMDRPGSSGDKNAKELIEKWMSIAENIRQRLNNLGADIRQRADWRWSQSWSANDFRLFGLSRSEKNEMYYASPERKAELEKQAKDRYLDEAMKRVDREQYRDDDGIALNDYALKEVLLSIHKTISTEGLSEAPRVVSGKSGLERSLGQARELHFKSTMDWYEFNKIAGNKDIVTNMIDHINFSSRDIAVLEQFGPNPAKNFESMLEWAKYWDAEARISQPHKIHKESFYAQNIFNEISGLNNIRGNANFAQFMADFRRLEVSSKLGSVLLSQVSDLSTFMTIARADGFGMGDSLRFIAKGLAGMNEADKKDARQAGIAIHTVISDVSSRVGEAAQGTRFTSKWANWTIRASGMKWWTDAMQRAYQMLISFHMAGAKDMAFDALDPRFSNMLKRHGIDQAGWDIIRRSETVEISGERMITPTTIKMLGETEGIDTRDLAIKVAGMLHENSMVAVATPGARQRAWINEHAPAGTKTGELMRSLALFHMFAISMQQRVLPRILNAEGTSGFRAGLMAQFVLGTVVAGAVSYQLKEISKGRNPRDISDAKFWLAAAAQGGGIGIFGDLAFADANRFGKSFATTLAGPMWGTVDDLYRVTVSNIHQAATGKNAHFWADAIQFGKNQAPLINLWYTRAALDHLLLYNAQEAANPGYLNRMQSRLKTENNQTMWWKPTDKMPTQGPDFKAMIGK